MTEKGREVKKALITRADDCASSHAANKAVYEAVRAGFIKNVSVLACGKMLDEAAEMLSREREVCFGLHGCINSEWDRVIWGPTAPAEQVRSLIDHRGGFYQTQKDYVTNPPVISEIITEYQYQLEKVRKAGFNITYMDSHMFPEEYIPGLGEAMSRMMEKEGLVDHAWFNRIIFGNDRFIRQEGLFEHVLKTMKGQYLMVMHPACFGSEILRTGNAEISGEDVARAREMDYRFVTDPANIQLCRKYSVELLRYDQAEKGSERQWNITKCFA